MVYTYITLLFLFGNKQQIAATALNKTNERRERDKFNYFNIKNKINKQVKNNKEEFGLSA